MRSGLWRLFSAGPDLEEAQSLILKNWRCRPSVSLTQPFETARYVVVDVETSGLNLNKDRLISIGAVAVVNGKIDLADSFYVVLQQAKASQRDNILLHGISGSVQTDGVPAAQALLDFLLYLGKDPLIAYHVTFDRTMIERAMRDYLGLRFRHPWSDVAYLAPGLHPALSRSLHSLDEWIDHFGIRNAARHNAMADALVTAQLFQMLLHQARQKDIRDLAGLMHLEKMQSWLRGRI